MNKLAKFKHLTIGFIVGSLFFSGISYAATTVNLKADYNVKILQNSIDRTPLADDMKPFISNGRTFMSLRAISELLGIEVDWDGAQRAVILGDIIEGTPLPAPNNISSTRDDAINSNVQFTISGQNFGKKGLQILSYGNSLYGPIELEYNLNAQFKTLSLAIGIDDLSSNGTTRTIEFLNDNGTVIQSVTLGKGMVQESINVNVSGLLKLKVKIQRNNDRGAYINFINPVLN